MKNLVVYGKGVESFFAKEGYLKSAEQLIKECDTIKEAKEIANHLNRVIRGERIQFNGYSVVYEKGVESFFIIEGDEANEHELLIERFETKKEALLKVEELNEMNGDK